MSTKTARIHLARRPSAQRWRQRLQARSQRISRSPRAVYRLLSLTPMGAAVAAIAGLPSISVWAQSTGNVIKPDGRTATQLQVQGARTDITTGTVKGDNAFNSFSRFEVGQGQTVNVHVPTQAQRVINIVTDAPIKVDGVLNGLKNGSLSGNLVFADPMGMVVGREGAINVNSLQVVAPTRAHLDAMMDAQGRIGDAAVKQLLDGQAPQSEDGRVQISGRINALERVRVEARRIDIEGRIKAGADAAHDAAFRAAVSSNGLQSATGMVERGGVIELVADDAVKVSGTLDASQRLAPTTGSAAAIADASAGHGGEVQLRAATIVLDAASLIDVSGLQGGGVAQIGSMALRELATVGSDGVADAIPAAPVTQQLSVARGAEVQADAIERGDGGRVQFLSDGSADFGGLARARGGAMLGNGGFVEVSGRRRLQFYGLVDTRAPKGSKGLLLIDPETLTISEGAAGDSSCLGSSGDCSISTGTIVSLAASTNLVLQAGESITLGGSGGSAATLDLSSVYTSKSSDSITLLSKDITFNAGSKLITGGGAVKLIALGDVDSSKYFDAGSFSYSSDIGWGPLSIGEKVDGGTITLNSGSAIITRGVSSGDAATGNLARDAGDVTLRAKNLDLKAGSQILAQAESGSSHKGGAVELTAYSLQQWNLGKATAISSAKLAGTVKADSIVANAVARAEASPDGAWGFAVSTIQKSLGALTGLSAAYHETQADATLEVLGTATLEAKTDLSLNSASVNKAAGSINLFTMDELGNKLAAAAAAYVKTAGDAELLVRSGATLNAGGKLSAVAHNDATAKSNVKVLSNSAIAGVAVSYLESDVKANAQIDSGANLNVGSLELLALQTGNFRNIAKSTIAQEKATQDNPNPAQAAMGASVAISDLKASSSATLGASVGKADGKVGDVTVVADTSLWQNYIAARNDAGGDPTKADKLKAGLASDLEGFAANALKLDSWLSEKTEAMGNLAKGAPPIKGAAVVTVNDTDLTSTASIGAGAVIQSSGKVGVVAQTEDRSVHNIAESKSSTKDAAKNGPALAAAVAVGLYDHGAEATVGEGAQINAAQFGLQSHVYQPLDVTWLAAFSLDGLSDPAGLFSHFVPPKFGMPQYVFTSWATAMSKEEIDPNNSDPDKAVAAAGSFNWTSFTNRSKAWVGAKATITTAGPDLDWSISWKQPTAPLLDGDVDFAGETTDAAGANVLREDQSAVDAVQSLAKNAIGEITGFLDNQPVVLGVTLLNSASFKKAVDIKALNQSAFLTLTGQPANFGFKGIKPNVQGGPVSAGAAFNYAGAEHTTIAGIDDGAKLTLSAGTLGLEARSEDRIIAVAPTAGRGDGAVINLIAAYSELDNRTIAVLSNKATVTAPQLDVLAVEDVSVWSAAGAAAYGGNAAGVGIAIAVNELDARTLAAIADPDDLVASYGELRPTGFNGATVQGSPQISADAVRVIGSTQGTSGALSASVGAVESEDPNAKKPDENVKKDEKGWFSKKWEWVTTKTGALRDKAVDKLQTEDGALGKARNALAEMISSKQDAAKPTKPTAPKLALAGAGSASVNLGNLDTDALVDRAKIVDGTGTNNSVLVRASNETHQYSISGSGALLKLKAPESQNGVGVSGAIAIDIEENDTSARLVDSTVSQFDTVSVESLSAGQRISAGLGIAGGTGNKPTYLASVSYSMTESDNSTTSAIDGGSIDGLAAGKTAVEVLAYDKTETGVGAGALTVQKSKGGAAGASIGVALVHNAVEARIAGATVRNASAVDVRAYDPVVIGIGAASLGISTEQNSYTVEGSVAYAELENTTRAYVGERSVGQAITRSDISSDARLTVQASDLVGSSYKNRFDTVLAADGTPPADSEYDFGASLRQGSQEDFGGQRIGTSQPGALVIGVAGGIAAGSSKAAGAAASASRLANVHEAIVEGATINAADMAVDATDATLMVNVGLGVAGTSDKIALAGSVAVTLNEDRATARIGASGKTTSITTTGGEGLSLTAASSERAFTIAGSVAVSTSGTAGGIAAVYGQSDNVAEALLSHATVTTTAAKVESGTASQHIGVAAAGGYGDKAAVNGSFVIHLVGERTTASVADSTLTADTLRVKAGDSDTQAAQVYTGAGSIGFSGGVAGGAALNTNTITMQREALVERSDLTLNGTGEVLDVQANSRARMIGVTIAGGGSKDAAFNGAVSSNEIGNTVQAEVAGSKVQAAAGNAAITARDQAEIDFGTGAISIAANAAIGAAISFNYVHNDVSAALQGSDAYGLRHANGSAVSLGDLRVEASSDATIINAAYGVAISTSVGGAGSIAVNLMQTEVDAHIGRGADVSAEGTVGVLATGSDDIKSFGGAAGIGISSAGVGLSATVNMVEGSTSASIGADDEARVSIDAKGKGAGMSVNSGTLTTPLPGLSAAGTDPSSFDGLAAMKNYDATRAKMAETSETVKGIAVNATSLHHVLSYDTTVGVGEYAGIGANAAAHVIKGATTAEIAKADVNQRASTDTDAAQSVRVKSTSHNVMASFGLGVGASAGFGAAGAIGGDVFLNSTHAQIRDAKVKAADDILVKAANEAAQSSLLVGFAAGSVAAAGTAGVVVFDGDVQAAVFGGELRSGDDTKVEADNAATLNVISGAGALALGPAGAGAITVLVSDTKTEALIGRSTDTTKATKVSTGGDLDVLADSTTGINTITVAVGGGLGTAGAAIGTVSVVTNEVTAAVRHADLEVGVTPNWVYGVGAGSGTGSGELGSDASAADGSAAAAAPSGALRVEAGDHDAITQISGAAGLGFGGGGIGGTVSVLVARSNVAAELSGSEIDAGTLSLKSQNTQNHLAGTVGVGVGDGFGAGFAVSLMMLGTGNPDADAFGGGDNAKGSALMSSAVSLTKGNRLGETGGTLSASQRTSLENDSKRDLGGVLKDAGSNSASASVDASTVRASGQVDVAATQDTALSNYAGAAGAALVAGAGGAVGVSLVYNAAVVEVSSDSSIDAGGNLNLASASRDISGKKALEIKTVAGGVGFAGLGASVGVGRLDNLVSTTASGTLKGSNVSLTALDSSSAAVANAAAAAGGGALGVAVSTLDRRGTVEAWVNKGGALNRSVSAQNLLISAEVDGSIEAKSLAAAGGLVVSGNGAGATASDTQAVRAGIGDNTQVTVGDGSAGGSAGTQVLAQRGTQLDAVADGVGVSGGVQLGASVALAELRGETAASVGKNVVFDAYGSLAVSAEESSANSLKAAATASGGGWTAALNASVAQAENHAAVRASIGDGTLLPDDAVALVASHSALQKADASGVTVGGLLALGGNEAEASTYAQTSATLGNVRTRSTRLGDLQLGARGTDETRASAMAGGGGLVSGQAAIAKASDESSTTATISAWGSDAQAAPEDYTLRAGRALLGASHVAKIRADSDTLNASVVGGSGALASSEVETDVTASIGDKVRVRALGLGVLAENEAAEQDGGDNAAGAGGGLANGSAVQAKTHVTTTADALVGEGAQLTVIGDPYSDGVGRMVIVAGTDLLTRTRGSLNTGGLVDVPFADVESIATGTNRVTIGANAQLHSAGDLVLGTTTLNRSSADSLIKTYGGVGVTGGSSFARSAQTDRVDIAGGALLQAYGDITVATGRNADGGLNLMRADASTQLYNYTIIPITTSHPATAQVAQDSQIRLADGSQVLAGGTVYLRAFKGDLGVSAVGEGHNPYLELFSVTTHDSNPSLAYSGTLKLDGAVTAGYYRRHEFAIDRQGNLTQSTDSPELALPVKTFTMDAAGNYFDAAGKAVDAALALNPQGYVAHISNFNPSLYYDDTVKAKFGSVPDAAMGAYVLPNLYAAGGNIEIEGSSVTGSGALRAQGGPLLKVANASNHYLLANKLIVADAESGGNVDVIGSTVLPAGLKVQEVDPGRMPAIDLRNTFDPTFGGGQASDIVLQAASDNSVTVRNPRGSFTLYNDWGNFWGGAADVLLQDVKVPQGTTVLDSTGYLALGGTPQNTWAALDAQYRPATMGAFIDTVAYAYYKQYLGGTSTDAFSYSAQLQGITSQYSTDTGYLFHSNLGNRPGGAFPYNVLSWYGGRYYFDVLPVKSLTSTSSNGSSVTVNPPRVHNRLVVNAKYIDVNTTIYAGTARNIDVTIKDVKLYPADSAAAKNPSTGTKLNFFDCVASVACRSLNGLSPVDNGLYQVPASALSFGADSPTITVVYDPTTKRVSTQSIGSSSPGSVTLVGTILNSNPGSSSSSASKIELSTGSLKLNIDNQSGVALELPRIETSANGAGVVTITDLGQMDKVYSPTAKKDVMAPLTTWYVSENGNDVKMYQSRTASSYEGLTPITSSTVNGATEDSYSPAAGWRYGWTRQATAKRQLIAANTGYWDDYYATSWEYTNESGTAITSADWRLVGSGYVFKDLSLKDVYYKTSFGASAGFTFQKDGVTYGGVKTHYTSKEDLYHVWKVATSASLTQTSSVKADFGIGIKFKGYTDGAVTISSNADTYLNKTLSNAGGDTSFTLSKGARLLGNQNGLIVSRNLTINGSGDIGGYGESSALNVQLVGGSLNAKTPGNLSVHGLGSLTIEQASAGQAGQEKRLTISATGDILAASDKTVLRGFEVELASENGRIGGSASAEALAVELFNSGSKVEQRGLLSASARGDIDLELRGGDKRIVEIASKEGHVKLATDGSLYDASEASVGGGRSSSELLALWEDQLHIAGDRAAAVQDVLTHTIAPLDQLLTRDYRDYWSLRALGNIGSDGRITLGSAGLSTLRAQAAAALNTAKPSDSQVNDWANTLLARYSASFDKLLGAGQWQQRPEFQSQQAGYRFSADRYNEYWQLLNATDAGRKLTTAGRQTVRQIAATVLGASPTDAQLQAYVDQRFAVLAADFSAGLGSGWASQAAFTSYDANYQFSGDAALLKTYTYGSYWGKDRLENQIRQSAIGADSGSSSIDHLNISGREVQISSSVKGTTLGRDKGWRELLLGKSLSDDDRFALSQASAPGDVQVITDANGAVIGLKVRDTRAFFIEAKTRLDADVPGQIYVQSPGQLLLGQVKSEGMVRLFGQTGIAAVPGAAAPQVEGASLVLDGGSGSIGSKNDPLQIKAAELSLARAAGSIYLSQAEGPLTVDLLTAGQDVALQLLQGSLLQKQPGLLSLSGENIALDVKGDVGADPLTGGNALQLQVLGGALTLKAGGSAWMGVWGDQLALGDSQLGGALNIAATGTAGLNIVGNVSVGTQTTLLIGGDFKMAAAKQLVSGGDLMLSASSAEMAAGSALASSQGRIDIAVAAGDATLGSLTARTGIAVDAELGRVLASDAAATLRVQDAGGLIAINTDRFGGQGVGSASLPLRLAADHVALHSEAGDIQVRLLNSNVTLDGANANGGSLLLQADGSVRQASQLLAAADLLLTAAGSFVQDGGTLAQAGGALDLSAQQISMGSGSRMQAGSIALNASGGDASLTQLDAAGSIDVSAQGRISGGAQLAAGSVSLSAGAGVGSAGQAVGVNAGQLSASSTQGGIYLQLSGANTRIDAAQGGTGDIEILGAGAIDLAGPVGSSGAVTVQAQASLSGAGAIEARGAGHALTLRGASLALSGAMLAGGDARLSSTSGDMALGSLRAGGSVLLDSAGAIRLDDVEAALDLRLAAHGPVSGGRLVAGRRLDIAGVPSLTLRELGSGSDLSLGLDELRLERLSVGGNFVLGAEQATLRSLSVGKDAKLEVAQQLELGQGSVVGALQASARTMLVGNLAVGGAAALNVERSLQGGSIGAGGTLDLKADTAALDGLAAGAAMHLRANTLQTGRIDAGSTLLAEGGELALGSVQAKAGAQIKATGSGSAASLTLGGDLDWSSREAVLGQLDVGGRTRLSVEQRLQHKGGAQLGGDLLVDAAAMELGTVDLAGKAELKSLQSLHADALQAKGSLLLSAGSDLKAGTLSGSAVTLQAGSADIGRLLSGAASELNVDGVLSLAQATIGGSLDARAGAMALGEVAVAGAAQLRAGRIAAQSFSSGAALDLQAGDAAFERLAVKGVATLKADERLAIGQGSFDAAVQMQAPELLGSAAWTVGGPLSLAAQNATLAQLSVAGAADFTLGGALALAQASFAGDWQASAASMKLGGVDVRGNAGLKASGALQADSLTVGGSLVAEAGSLHLGRALLVQPTALGDAAAPGLKVDKGLSLQAQQIELAKAQIGGDASIVAGDQLVMAGSSSFGGALTGRARSMAIDELSVQGRLSLDATDALTLGRLSGSSAALKAATLKLGDATASGTLDLVSGGATEAGSLTAGTALTLKAGGAVTAALLRAPTVDVQAGADMRLDLLDARDATLETATQIALREGRIGQSIALRADRIEAGLYGADGGELRSSASGVDGQPASLVKLALNTPTRWIMTDLDTVDASFSTLGRWTQFDQAHVSGRMTLSTPDGLIALTNDKVERVPGADVQLYAPSGDFILLRDRQYAYTTALALVYKPNQFVSAPNTMLSPLIVAQGGSTGGAAVLARAASASALRVGMATGAEAEDPEALLRRAPTASGQDEDLVGELEF